MKAINKGVQLFLLLVFFMSCKLKKIKVIIAR
jgi:hypothetical protein